jgi:hypothetical protein
MENALYDEIDRLKNVVEAQREALDARQGLIDDFAFENIQLKTQLCRIRSVVKTIQGWVEPLIGIRVI